MDATTTGRYSISNRLGVKCYVGWKRKLNATKRSGEVMRMYSRRHPLRTLCDAGQWAGWFTSPWYQAINKHTIRPASIKPATAPAVRTHEWVKKESIFQWKISPARSDSDFSPIPRCQDPWWTSGREWECWREEEINCFLHSIIHPNPYCGCVMDVTWNEN